MPQPRKARNADIDKPEEPEDTRWWVIVTASNEIVGSGRYGVWEEKPKCQCVDGIVHVWGRSPDEAEVFIGMGNTVTVALGQSKHFDARPMKKSDPDEA